MKAAKAAGYKPYKLGPVCESLGIKLNNAHRALDDAIACGHVWWALKNAKEAT